MHEHFSQGVNQWQQKRIAPLGTYSRQIPRFAFAVMVRAVAANVENVNGLLTQLERNVVRNNLNTGAQRQKATMRIPYTGHPDRSRFKHRFGTLEGEACIQCGRRVYPVKLRVHMVSGGGELASLDEPDDPPQSEMGWHAIGSDCARKLPSNFIQREG